MQLYPWCRMISCRRDDWVGQWTQASTIMTTTWRCGMAFGIQMDRGIMSKRRTHAPHRSSETQTPVCPSP
ncbi:hypothetical protein VTJ04DRAFT_5152 [Mycothermus thermophilus]|uniref:uncharacterized protein n=1 Tax=Humicola insolens TaxID=85995 RepID=UPI00374314BE